MPIHWIVNRTNQEELTISTDCGYGGCLFNVERDPEEGQDLATDPAYSGLLFQMLGTPIQFIFSRVSLLKLNIKGKGYLLKAILLEQSMFMLLLRPNEHGLEHGFNHV